jgi:hypothetical protein
MALVQQQMAADKAAFDKETHKSNSSAHKNKRIKCHPT